MSLGEEEEGCFLCIQRHRIKKVIKERMGWNETFVYSLRFGGGRGLAGKLMYLTALSFFSHSCWDKTTNTTLAKPCNEKWPSRQCALHESASQLDGWLTSQKHRAWDPWHFFCHPAHQTAFEPKLTGVWDRIKRDPGADLYWASVVPTDKASHVYSVDVWFWPQLKAPETTQWSVSEGWGKLGTYGATMEGQVCPSYCPGLSFFLAVSRAPWFCSGKHLSRRLLTPVQGWTQSSLPSENIKAVL